MKFVIILLALLGQAASAAEINKNDFIYERQCSPSFMNGKYKCKDVFAINHRVKKHLRSLGFEISENRNLAVKLTTHYYFNSFSEEHDVAVTLSVDGAVVARGAATKSKYLGTVSSVHGYFEPYEVENNSAKRETYIEALLNLK